MENTNGISKSQALTTKDLFSRDSVKAKFTELLGKKAQGFITSVLQIVSSNSDLSKADPLSVYNSAAMAATLDLPLNNNLGFAYIVPYKQKQPDGKSYKHVAQFQMGYKGYIQLAQRSGQYKAINATDVREGEIKNWNRMTGEITFEWIQDDEERLKKPVVGYAAYFQLHNGFEKTLFMSVRQLEAHGLRFSQTYKKGYGLWKDDFDSMALKTVLKMLLSKFGPLSIDLQRAVVVDQAVINDAETQDVTYVDNEEPEVDKEAERIALLIQDAKTLEELEQLQEFVPENQLHLFEEKKEELKAK
jgi:recombination protein RecT